MRAMLGCLIVGIVLLNAAPLPAQDGPTSPMLWVQSAEPGRELFFRVEVDARAPLGGTLTLVNSPAVRRDEAGLLVQTPAAFAVSGEQAFEVVFASTDPGGNLRVVGQPRADLEVVLSGPRLALGRGDGMSKLMVRDAAEVQLRAIPPDQR